MRGPGAAEMPNVHVRRTKNDVGAENGAEVTRFRALK